MRGPLGDEGTTHLPRVCNLEDTEPEPCEQLARVSQHPLASSASNDNVQEICQTFRWLGDFLNLFSVSSCLRGESLFFHAIFTSTGS